MAMNNYVGDSALKWPSIFISASRQRCGQRGGVRGRGGERVVGPVCINSDVSHSPVGLERSIRGLC